MYFPPFAKSFSTGAVCDSPLSRKYCQYFRIGMKQDLFSPWTNHSWYRLLGFSLPSFFTHCEAKRMLWFVFWKVWSGTKAKLCWTGGPTSLKKAPRDFLTLIPLPYGIVSKRKDFQCLCLKIVFVLWIKYRLLGRAKKSCWQQRGFSLMAERGQTDIGKVFSIHIF